MATLAIELPKKRLDSAELADRPAAARPQPALGRRLELIAPDGGVPRHRTPLELAQEQGVPLGPSFDRLFGAMREAWETDEDFEAFCREMDAAGGER